MNSSKLRPVCFMVMPFRTRKVGQPAPEGAPVEVNFDRLWDQVYAPAIGEAGFQPVRADFETGSVIVKDMLERLAFADLVLADVTLPNGNVYYEVGLRQVAKETGCILFAASWSKRLFDIEQFRTVPYDLPTSSVSEEAAPALRSQVLQAILDRKHVTTPWYEFVGAGADQGRKGVFRDFAETFSSFQARTRAVRLSPKTERKALVEDLVKEYQAAASDIPEVATELLSLIRDHLSWADTLAFCDTLPERFKRIPWIREQALLATAKLGKPASAIASLEQLIKEQGHTPERLGLIGGRYKALWRAERAQRMAQGAEEPSPEEEDYLERAIEHYARGMQLDLNEYYCSCNIAELFLARGEAGDARAAEGIDQMVIAACERAIALGIDDGWTRPTLLGAAFRASDVPKAAELAKRVRKDGPAAWALKTTLEDLAGTVERLRSSPAGNALQGILDDLSRLLRPAAEPAE